MAKFADTNLDDFENDYEAYFDKAFNNLIQTAVAGLSTPEHSPVYTGLFASSWKARQNRPIERDSREKTDRFRRDKDPWKNAYKTKTTNSAGRETEWGPMPQGGMEQIKRRFKVPDFNYKKGPVYIGNQVHYAQYALEDGRPLAFIQGMKKIVDNAFQEKLRLGSIYAGVSFAPQQQMGGQLTADYQGNPILE
jgi:hypothetical protein